MTINPTASYLKAVEAIEERIKAIKDELDALRLATEAVDADAEISLSLEDIEAGWNEAKLFAELVAQSSPHLAHGLLVAHLRCLDGWFGAGILLSRSEIVSRRFGPKAHVAARAAKAHKNTPVQQTEADIIAHELAKLPVRPPKISPYTAAHTIESAVNKRLKKVVIDGRPLKALSVTTIARRIIGFNL